MVLRKLCRLAAILPALLLLAACGTGSTDMGNALPGPLFSPPVAGFAPGVVSGGDIIEVAFFERGEINSAEYKLRGGDVLSINLVDHPEMMQERVLVLPDGTISLSGFNQIHASGLTTGQLASVLEAQYENVQIRNPKVSISVQEADVRVRSLIQVSTTGSRPFDIVVDDAGYIDLPFISPIKTGRPLADIQQEIHDAYARAFDGRIDVTVNLRERVGPRVFVFGEVGNPGGVPYQSPMTSLMAISSAGGFADTANSQDVRLFRLQADGRFSAQTLKLRQGSSGPIQLESDVAVRPGDVLYIPKTGIAVANLWVQQYIRNMLPTVVGFGVGYDLHR